MIDDIKKLRQARRALEDSLAARLNALRAREAQLARARRRGKGGAEEAAAAEREIAALREAIERDRSSRQGMSRRESDLVGSFVLQQTPQQLASQLDDRLPCLLFPLRIETRFMRSPTGIELWVRVYPDDIAVHTHEEALTRDEAEAGLRYWTERAVAAAIDDAAERERGERGAWRSLVNSAGGPRASWIASELRRRARAKEGDDRFAFLLFRVQVAEILAQPDATPSDQASAIAAILTAIHPLIDSVRSAITALLAADPQLGDDTPRAILSTLDDAALTYLDFDLGALKAESWSRPPRTEILPDRFVLIGFAHGVRREFPFPNPVPTPLILGPDPQKGESELVQRDGDLLVGEDYAWIWDFERAIAMGMAMRTPLPSPFERGFDRLLVLGLRVSESAADHAALLEALIDNHHYAPEGMGFLAQGSPTNHTAEVRSAVSSDDADGDASFDVETTEPEVPPPGDDLDRTDAQRLAEAWDVDVRTLLGLRDAGVRDVAEAKVMNRALWPATLGFFLEELLEVEPAAIDRLRSWFTAHVVARGSLPAIHVGKQPYGVLLTSAFRKWRIDEAVDGEDAPFQRRIHEVLTRIEDQWQALVGRVSTVDSPGDSFAHLLNMLGLHPTSVDFARRIGTQRTLIWNLAHMIVGANFTATDPHVRYFQQVSARGLAVMEALGFSFPRPPRLFGLLFSDGTSPLNGPLVDDVATAEDEQFSETVGLPAKYTLTIGGEVQEPARNYIGWLVASELNTLKQQDFRDANGNALPIPLALLYRMLHRALLLASHDATMKLYEEIRRVSRSVRVEGDFTNVEAGRTVTRWEFMEARVNEVMPEVSGAALAVGDFLSTREGLERPVARFLAEVRDAIGRLEGLPTARLERLFAEHVDLCSYRLDAWQTSLFAARLERLNALRQDPIEPGGVKRGVHIGAYGWLENVRPGPLPKVVSPDEIPNDLQEPGVDVVEQPNNGGYIHGPSINHAAAAAVLRNAYLTHARQDNAEHFAVKVTSERVRTALAFLDGIRNGQELGALLGYQFERALHDRYVIDGKALAQFILAFRTRFPLVADKVTPDPAQDSIQHKEAYQVVDGYALLEAVFLQQPPLAYPFGVVGLPLDPADGARQAIIAEVERLRDTLDAISDLALAEGVFQVSQGNHERAGAMLKAISEGNAPPEPEIVNTPRARGYPG